MQTPLLVDKRLGGTIHLSAFTRLESIFCAALLVIVFFLAVPICGCGGSREGARASKAASVTRSVQNAIASYAEDYGAAPRVAAPRNTTEQFIVVGPESAGASISNAGLFDVLRAIPRGVNEGHALNARQQKYFEDARATEPKNPREGFADGADFPASIQGQLIDPWGVQYCVVLETDNDQCLNLGGIYSDLGSPGAEVRSGIAVFSLGKDGKLGTRKHPGRLFGDRADRPNDIISWDVSER